ncbi:hypothetical protein GSI_10205 [Ganoderma sinense ZZ0214-1]|uniref:Uncharacterized protein n=1 Tax=Ganoderma sinense ZZ0214-1 TaxID=1077348 RepID=A0A2G8RZX2_9APHY|nr:hypothetical protein GSI_10205 [Ganoderma sinense ZZ0214-1]
MSTDSDGITQAIQNSLQDISISEVTEDFEAEIEAIENALEVEDEAEADSEYFEPVEVCKRRKVSEMDLESRVEKASEYVVIPRTLRDYINIWTTFTEFVVLLGVVSPHDATRDEFWKTLPHQLPLWITAFIMSKADDIDVFTGAPKPPDSPQTTYANAQKLRAAVSHKFGRGFKLVFAVAGPVKVNK